MHTVTPRPSDRPLDLVLNGEWHDKQDTAGAVDDNSGGTVLYIAPGARLSLSHWSGFLSVGVPILTDMNGTQAEPDWRLVSGLSIGF